MSRALSVEDALFLEHVHQLAGDILMNLELHPDFAYMKPWAARIQAEIEEILDAAGVQR
jgi:hypothetical protein